MKHYVDNNVTLSKLALSKFTLQQNAVPYINQWEDALTKAICCNFKDGTVWTDAVYSLQLHCKAMTLHPHSTFDRYNEFVEWIELWKRCITEKYASLTTVSPYTDEEVRSMKPYNPFVTAIPAAFDFSANIQIIVSQNLTSNIMWNINLKPECRAALLNIQTVMEMKISLNLITYSACLDAMKSFCRTNASSEGFYDNKGLLAATVERWYLFNVEKVRRMKLQHNAAKKSPQTAKTSSPEPQTNTRRAVIRSH